MGDSVMPLFELKNMSCFDYIKEVPSNSVDLVLIDPPYEISRDTNFKKGGSVERLKVSMDFGTWDKGFEGLDILIKDLHRVLKDGGTLICFYDLWKITTLKNYFELASFKQLRFIEWIKSNPVPLNSQINYLTNSREVALVGIKGSKPTFNSSYDNGVYTYGICRDSGRFHPTQKPKLLIKELITKHSNECDVVLDCFSGSGTTAVASIELNRIFKGCELDLCYFEKSIERITKVTESNKSGVILTNIT